MKDEVLKKLNNTDASVIPRYNIILPTGEVVYSRVQIVLQNTVLEPGTPLNAANLLSDNTSTSLGLDPTTSTPNEAFAKLFQLVKGICPKIFVKYTEGGTVYIRNEVTLEILQAPVATSGTHKGYAIINVFDYSVFSAWGIYNDTRTDYPSLITVDTAKNYEIQIT